MVLKSRIFSILIPSVLLLFTASKTTWGAVPTIAPERSLGARELCDDFRYDTLEDIRNSGLSHAELDERPWSGWHWPFTDAGLASRYADSGFPRGSPWDSIRTYLLTTLGAVPPNLLSPAEKYDALVGDSEFSLTIAMLRKANVQARGNGIEDWMGYCTGLAAASFMLPRPAHAVSTVASDGLTRIEFRPDDIKALGALLWSTGTFPFRVTGRTCAKDPIQRDPETDRPVESRCQGVNPATLHLSLVNQIGVARRSLILDVDPGRPVWNHAVHGYSYRYFNPGTNTFSGLSDAKAMIGSFSDRFAKYRSPEAHQIVGIELELNFVYVREPEAVSGDSPARDLTRTPIYRYDLELDAVGRIIGGEWHSRLRPDVLWIPGKEAKPDTVGDRTIGKKEIWDPGQPIPPSWTGAAQAGSRNSQPLRRVVEALFTASSRK